MKFRAAQRGAEGSPLTASTLSPPQSARRAEKPRYALLTALQSRQPRHAAYTLPCPLRLDSGRTFPLSSGLGRAAHLSAAVIARPWGWRSFPAAPRLS